MLQRLTIIWRSNRGRPAASLVLVIFALLLANPDLPPFKALRLSLFDHYQQLMPREQKSQNVTIVAIDEDTLKDVGQWPWPRNYFAALIDAIAARKPAAIGLDIIMPEPDHASPQAVAESRPDLPENVRQWLYSTESNDRELANSLAAAPVVLGAAGFSFKTAATVAGMRTKPLEVQGPDPLAQLNRYDWVLASLPEFQVAAHGQALLSNDSENGIVRRVAVLSDLNRNLTPGLSLEMLRVARAAPAILVKTGTHGIEAAHIGDLRIPLQSNGEAWLHFSSFSEHRYLSAKSLLNGEASADRIEGKLVLVGLTGLGLQDYITTPLGDHRFGVETHAQLLESIEDGHFLVRPWWMHWAELSFFLIAGLLLIWDVPQRNSADTAQTLVSAVTKERRSRVRTGDNRSKFLALIAIPLFLLLFSTGFGLFYWCGWLFDAASLFIAFGAVLASLLASAFLETEQERKKAEIALQNQRIRAAQLEGELDAARRIQLGTLPSPAMFSGETRFTLDAKLEPARQVGGDLYDFFMMDERHLFFIIGDVSGKGLPASLFMAVTKALSKSIALRGHQGIDNIINLANTEMARENPEMLFVTAVAGILDVESGELELVNAGHDAPWRIQLNGNIEAISSVGGPPLCVLDDFDYPVEYIQLAPGDTLLLLTDGITEAMNAKNELYGMERVRLMLDKTRSIPDLHPDALLAILRENLRVFVGDTEPSDDLTLLAIRWR